MSERIIGDTITLDFTTHDPHTGQVSDADVLPTCEVLEDNDDTPILTPTVVKRGASTGLYRVTFAATAANGFLAGSSYNADVVVTVTNITAKARIGSFRLNSIRVPEAHYEV